MAEDERFGSELITIDVERHGMVVINRDDDRARYSAGGWLTGSRPAAEGVGRPVRMLVEVLRRFGGHVPRALLGGEFLPAGRDHSATIEVGYVAGAGESAVASCPSRLWNRPFCAGLPEEFASAVLDGLVDTGARLPPGVLRVDRAGFDEVESSAWVFGLAANVLGCGLVAMFTDANVEAEIRRLISTW
ncbi:MAG TPA: hypothetical protein VFX70_17890 [Mycobacteriales bacterium]|nr:hypothetical protein [Mycobacteriales bacterium]